MSKLELGVIQTLSHIPTPWWEAGQSPATTGQRISRRTINSLYSVTLGTVERHGNGLNGPTGVQYLLLFEVIELINLVACLEPV